MPERRFWITPVATRTPFDFTALDAVWRAAALLPADFPRSTVPTYSPLWPACPNGRDRLRQGCDCRDLVVRLRFASVTRQRPQRRLGTIEHFRSAA